MPKKKKPLTTLSSEEAIKKLFPKKVIKEAQKESHKKAPKSLLIKG